MKHWSELNRLETQIIRLETMRSLFSVLASGAEESSADDIRNALNYALSSKAQSLADDLGYVPLSGSILNRARIAVGRIGN